MSSSRLGPLYSLKPDFQNRLRPVACGLFNPDYVERLLNDEMEGVPGLRHGLKLWMLVTFLLWHEQMVESPSAS